MIHPSNVWESYSRALEQGPLVKKWEKSGEKRENFSTLFSSLWRSSAESLPQSVMKKVIKLALSLLQGRATIAERGSPTILEHTWFRYRIPSGGGMIDHSRLLKGFSSFRWYFYLFFHTDHLNWAFETRGFGHQEADFWTMVANLTSKLLHLAFKGCVNTLFLKSSF